MCAVETDAPGKTSYFPPCSASLTRFPGNMKSFRGLFFGIALTCFRVVFIRCCYLAMRPKAFTSSRTAIGKNARAKPVPYIPAGSMVKPNI